MSVDLAISFFALTRERTSSALRALAQLSAHVGDALRDLEVGWNAPARTLLAHAAVDPGPDLDDVLQRVEFWIARAGGRTRVLAWMRDRYAFRSALAACALPGYALSPQQVAELLTGVVAGLDEALAFPLEDGAGTPPVLELWFGTPASHGITYDPRGHALFVPAPSSPARGDSLVLRLGGDRFGASPLRVGARVAEVRRAENASPGAPAGFCLELAPMPPAARAALAASAAPGARAAPRYPVRARAMLRPVPEGGAAAEGVVLDLSAHGARIATALRPPIGARIQLETSLGASTELLTPAVVARGDDGEIVVRFDLDAEAHAVLAEALTRIVGRRRQVLILESSRRARRATANVFRRRGFDVIATGDLVYGMQALAAELAFTDGVVVGSRIDDVDPADLVRAVHAAAGVPKCPLVVVEDGSAPGQTWSDGVVTIDRSLPLLEVVRAMESLLADVLAPAPELVAAESRRTFQSA